MARIDDNGAAFAGSQLQTQLYVNRRTDQLNQSIQAALPELVGASIEWVSPIQVTGYREYQDRAFLDQLGLSAHAEHLPSFWPRGGPVWDGLARVTAADGRAGVLLAEGKSYPAELYGSGCQAKTDSDSRKLITQALKATQKDLGLPEHPEKWMGRLYQTANRLAHLLWLRDQRGVPAWFVHLLFADDSHGPTSAEQWHDALKSADQELGLPAHVGGAAHVLLPAGTHEELVGRS